MKLTDKELGYLAIAMDKFMDRVRNEDPGLYGSGDKKVLAQYEKLHQEVTSLKNKIDEETQTRNLNPHPYYPYTLD